MHRIDKVPTYHQLFPSILFTGAIHCDQQVTKDITDNQWKGLGHYPDFNVQLNRRIKKYIFDVYDQKRGFEYVEESSDLRAVYCKFEDDNLKPEIQLRTPNLGSTFEHQSCYDNDYWNHPCKNNSLFIFPGKIKYSIPDTIKAYEFNIKVL